MTSQYLRFATGSAQIEIRIEPGEAVLVAGPNGVGKSALLHALYRSLPQGTGTYLPGHRQINFNNGWETTGIDAVTLKLQLFQHPNNFNRYKGNWAEDQLKMTIRTLLHAESAYNRAFRLSVSTGGDNTLRTAAMRASPVDKVNTIFEAARLLVRFTMTDEGVSAQKGDQVYAIDALSDGERASLFIAAAMVTQQSNAVLLIDEPEKHLHPSITGLLISACLRSRPDVSVVIASHDVHLIEGLHVDHIIHIRGSTIVNMQPELRIFEAEVLVDVEDIPDDLKRDLLGTRSEILFIEGEQSSADISLYGHVYVDVKLAPKGGYAKVMEAVKALRGMQSEHWLKPYGLIDGDGRTQQEVQSLLTEGIYTLPVPSIENLFFLDEAVECFIEADLSYRTGAPLAERLAALEQYVLGNVAATLPDVVARRVSWLIERELSARKLSVKQIRDNELSDIVIPLDKLKEDVERSVYQIANNNNYRQILFLLPIKNTLLTSGCARTLGAKNFDDYRKTILRQLDLRSGTGIKLLNALRGILPKLEADSAT